MAAKKIIWVRREKYDPLTGKFIREMRANDIVPTTGRSAAGGAIATSTNGANTILLPYILHFGSETGGWAVVALMAGSATLGIYFSNTNDDVNQIISTPDAPLGVVPASTTLSVDVLATESANATISVTVLSKRVPINSKISR